MARKKLKSLADLKTTLPKKKKAPSAYIQSLMDKAGGNSAKEAPPEPEVTEAEEMDLFSRAMSGVEQLGTGKGGRDITPAPPSSNTKRLQRVEEDWNKYLEQFVQGDIEFELEYTDEYMYGQAKGLDPVAWNQLKNGALSIEGHIDLHGMNSDQARESLLFFLRESYLQGRRCVLAVSGRGKNSPGGMSVLKREILSWLTHDPLRRVVLGFCTALPRDGGAGAVYVLLRKMKKNKGKVKWESITQWEDLD